MKRNRITIFDKGRKKETGERHEFLRQEIAIRRKQSHVDVDARFANKVWNEIAIRVIAFGE